MLEELAHVILEVNLKISENGGFPDVSMSF